MNIRFILHGIILSTLCTSFCYHLYFGKNGIKAYQKLLLEVDATRRKQVILEQKITLLKHDLDDWQNDIFVKEKVAREDLLYSYTHEHVFIVPNATT